MDICVISVDKTRLYSKVLSEMFSHNFKLREEMWEQLTQFSVIFFPTLQFRK